MLRPLTRLTLGLYVCLLPQINAAAGTLNCAVESPAQTVSLLELYTSEGCSSCPPADRWLSRLKLSGAQVVPLAFHVDYWDDIGWKDRFANPQYSARQRRLASLQRSPVVYTPQILLNGSDFRGWGRAGALEAAVASVNAQPAAVNIHLMLNEGGEEGLRVKAEVKSTGGEIGVLYFVLYENNLSTVVRAGENRGETLHHDYVVRTLRGPYRLKQQGANPGSNAAHTVEAMLPLDSSWKRGDLGVAAFVQQEATGRVLQAVAMRSCDKGG